MHKKRLLKASSMRKREAIIGYLFSLPSFIGFFIFVLFPILYAIYLSLQKQNVFTGEAVFVGLQNYIDLFRNSRTSVILGNTIWYTVFATLGNTLVGLFLAIALDDKMNRSVSVIFRSLYFFPSLVGLVFVAIIWQYLFQKDTGIINYYLSILNISNIGWLSDPDVVKISVLILDVWKNSGMAMLLFLAGLQGIGKSYYEAAKIDGAGILSTFFKITLPLLSPTLLFVLIMHLTGAMRIYESIVVLTNGGPGDSSRSLVMLIQEKAFKSYDYGSATALSIMLLLAVSIITWIQFSYSRKWVHYEG